MEDGNLRITDEINLKYLNGIRNEDKLKATIRIMLETAYKKRR